MMATQQDPAATRLSAMGRRLAADIASLVVIDAQNDFCHPDGRQAQQGQDVGRVAAAMQRLAGAIELARACAVPVIFVRTHHGPDSDTDAWMARHPDPTREQSCQVGTWGAEFCGVAPLPGEVVITKHRYSAFVDTPLRAVLDDLRRPSVLFAGFTTATCVESSLRDAVNGDLLATLLEDCSAAYTEAAHLRSVAAVESGFGLVTTSDELRRRWAPPSLVGVPIADPMAEEARR